MAQKEYQLAAPIPLRQAGAVRLARILVDFRDGSFQLLLDVFDPGGAVVDTRVIELNASRLDQLVALIANGTLSQTSFEEAVLDGAVRFDNQIPNDGTIVDL